MFNLKALLTKLSDGADDGPEEEWEVITAQEEGKTQTGMVDHAAVARAGEGGLLPVLCRLDWMGPAGARGLTDKVHALEGAVIDALRGQGGEYLGRLGLEGRQRIFLMVPGAAEGLAGRVKELADAKGFALDWQPSSQTVPEFLAAFLPDPGEKRRLADLTVLAELTRLDDDREKPRPVEHRIYFPKRAAAQAFASEARGLGYAVDPIEAEAGEYCVTLRHDCAMLEAAICAHTIPLAARAEAMGGDYDGWETETRPRAA